VILSAQQQRNWDAQTIEVEPIRSIDLMERASKRWLEHARPYLNKNAITVFAGFGNNGGDALVIARLLATEGYEISVVLCFFGKTPSQDAQTNLERLSRVNVKLLELQSTSDLDALLINPNSLLIDGIFGTGLRSGLQGEFAQLVHKINASHSFVLSIDIPSGLLSDTLNTKGDEIVKARHTISFQAAKLSFLMPESEPCFGSWTVIDIGLHSGFLEEITIENHLLTLGQIKALIVPRHKFSHKGSYGHAMIASGVSATIGASILASRAAISSGAGLTTLLSDEKGINLSYPELMISRLDSIKSPDRVTFCIGPGLGTNEVARTKLVNVLKTATKPMVLDADALNLLSNEVELLKTLPKQSVLTPHPKELERLIGTTDSSFEQLEKAREFAIEHDVVLLVKRAHTVIIGNDGQVYFNSTGNNGLAKGGSGDVLSGIISALLAQGYKPVSSALIGVYVHGLAADLAVKQNAYSSLTPEKVISHLSSAFKQLGI